MWFLNDRTCKSSLRCSCPASPGSSIVLSGVFCRIWNQACSENADNRGHLSHTGRKPASRPRFQVGVNKNVLLPACKASHHTEEKNRTGQTAPAADYTLHLEGIASSPVRRTCLGPVLILGVLKEISRWKLCQNFGIYFYM